jgi:hypothetical protein
MEALSDEVASQAKPEDSITKDQVKEMIDKRKLVEWSYETAKKLIKAGTSSA